MPGKRRLMYYSSKRPGNFEILNKVLGNHRAGAGTTTLGSFL